MIHDGRNILMVSMIVVLCLLAFSYVLNLQVGLGHYSIITVGIYAIYLNYKALKQSTSLKGTYEVFPNCKGTVVGDSDLMDIRKLT